jgi:hypothetical protein
MNSSHSGACFRFQCHLRARRSDGMVHTPARSDLDTDRRLQSQKVDIESGHSREVATTTALTPAIE